MDEQEAEYLRQHIHDLEHLQGRWRAVALVSLIALALFLVAGGLATVGLGLVSRQRMRVEQIRAIEAETEARQQAEQARQAEMEAREQAERARAMQKVETLPKDKTGGVSQP